MTKPADVATNEPQCPTCGYSLLGLTEHRCPECGEAFDPEYASIAAHLLPWERPETGSVVRRLFRMLIQASFHPARYFENVRIRKDRRIDRAGRLVVAFLLLSIGFQSIEYLAGKAIFFCQLAMKGLPFAKCFSSVMNLVSFDWSHQVAFWIFLVALPTLTVLVLAVLTRLFFRTQTGSLHWMGLLAAFSPLVAMLAFLTAFTQLISIVFQGAIEAVGEVMNWGGIAITLSFAAFACRRLLHLSRWKSIAMLIVVWVVQHGCGIAAAFLYSRFVLWRILDTTAIG